MNNHGVLERLSILLKNLGLKTDENAINFAEISAYAVAIENLLDETDTITKEMFLDSAETYGYSLFTALTNILQKDTVENTKEKIKARLSLNWGQFDMALFDSEKEDINSSLEFAKSGNEILLSGLNSIDDYKEIGRFILCYNPAFRIFKLAGNGMTFSEWDQKAFNFRKYDNMLLPFSIIDTF